MSDGTDSGRGPGAAPQLRALIEVSRAIARHRSHAELFRDLTTRLHHLLDFTYFSVVLHDAERGVMRLHTIESGVPVSYRGGEDVSMEDSPGGHVWATQDLLLIDDVRSEPRFTRVMAVLQGFGVRTFLSLPLTTAHRRLGALNFGHTRPAAYRADDLELSQQIAAQVAVAVDNALHSEQAEAWRATVEARAAELARANDSLRASEERTRAILNNSPNMIFLKDAVGRYLFVNKEFERAFHISQEEIRGQNDADVFPPDQAAAFRANDAQVLETGRPLEFEEVTRLDDGPHTNIVHEVPLLDADGTIYAIGGIVTDITERTRAKERLRHSEEQYRVVLETATDAVVSIDEDSCIVFANHATTRIFGHAVAELIGQPLAILMPQGMRERHRAGFERYLTTGQRHINWQGTELIGRRLSGEEFPIEVSFGEIVRNGHRLFTGFIRDITERKQAEAIRLAHARQTLVRADVGLALAREDALTAILHGCAEAMVRHLDATLARIWTLNEEDDVLELQASAGMYTHLDGAHSRVAVGRLKIGEIARERKPLLTNDVPGDPRISDRAWATRESIAAFAGYPLLAGDHLVGVMALFSRSPFTTSTFDTLASVADSIAQGVERKRAEAALAAMQSELSRITRMATMGEIAGSIAHEIGQPLGAIVNNGNACLHLLGESPAHLTDVRDALRDIVSDANRAAEVIARIRALSQKAMPEQVAVLMSDVVAEVLALVRRELADRGVAVHTDLADEASTVVGDRVQLQQVILNLVMNSLEAMSVIQDGDRKLRISTRRDEDRSKPVVLVTVEDSGIGLNLEHRERVFEAFYTTKRTGMGLGLSISRSIVEAHGGRLWALPKAGPGAVFQFAVPRTH